MQKLSMFDLFIGGNFLETISETLTIENDVQEKREIFSKKAKRKQVQEADTVLILQRLKRYTQQAIYENQKVA